MTNTTQTSPWFAQTPASFTDERLQLRDSGLVTLRVHAYRASLVRTHDGKQEWTRCGHAHQKPGAARKCGERLARKLNRETP